MTLSGSLVCLWDSHRPPKAKSNFTIVTFNGAVIFWGLIRRAQVTVSIQAAKETGTVPADSGRNCTGLLWKERIVSRLEAHPETGKVQRKAAETIKNSMKWMNDDE